MLICICTGCSQHMWRRWTLSLRPPNGVIRWHLAPSWLSSLPAQVTLYCVCCLLFISLLASVVHVWNDLCLFSYTSVTYVCRWMGTQCQLLSQWRPVGVCGSRFQHQCDWCCPGHSVSRTCVSEPTVVDCEHSVFCMSSCVHCGSHERVCVCNSACTVLFMFVCVRVTVRMLCYSCECVCVTGWLHWRLASCPLSRAAGSQTTPLLLECVT